MKINFTQIFQDSWNFIRNQRRFTLYFMLALCCALILFQFIDGIYRPQATQQALAQIDDFIKTLDPAMQAQFASEDPQKSPWLQPLVMVNPTMLTISVLSQVVLSFITLCGIVYIHLLSRQQPFSATTILSAVLRAFIGVLVINVLVFLPLVYGLMLAATGQTLALVLIIIGVYLFVRLCLAHFVYLLEGHSLLQALRTTWTCSQGGFGNLFLFCLLNYLLLKMIGGLFAAFSDNAAFFVLNIVFTAFIYIFSIIFSYRFYTLFSQGK